MSLLLLSLLNIFVYFSPFVPFHLPLNKLLFFIGINYEQDHKISLQQRLRLVHYYRI